MKSNRVWGSWFVATAVLALLLAMPAATVTAQETPDESTAAVATDAEAVDASAPPTAPAPPAPPAPAPPAPAPGANATGLAPWLMGLLVVALFVLPVMLGNYFAKQFRMPDHGWKFSVVIGAVACAGVIVGMGEFKFGPDLAGGITLVFELADTSAVVDEDADEPPGDEDQDNERRKVDIPKLISALKQRVDPSGTREVTIRQQGVAAIEIIIPATGPDALEYVKRRITSLGELEFRIVADSRQVDDRPAIEQARLVPPSQKIVYSGDRPVAEWFQYPVEEFGPPDEPDSRHVKRLAGDTPEILGLRDLWNVTGEFLTSASKGVDKTGGPAVHFGFNNQGARRFRELTGDNVPNQATGATRLLGIVLDKRMISAPEINEAIGARGIISGRSMDDKEVEHIVNILDAGSLPASLDKTPISEEIVSPTLGAVTIEKGKFAIGISFAAVVVFMMLYYRLSGVISVIALFLNLLLVMAAMVLIKAAFTLPGLAGLVLVIGMAVDANVLIFERIREELRSGAAMRMAIRNGFGRATATIVDANLTTVIAGLVLYTVGQGPIKGFAVTLVLGIMMSMFTAVFCSRVIFDVLERRGWIKQLKMTSVVGQTSFNFMAGRGIAVALSVVLIVVGMLAVYQRGSSFLNIDFTGGSSVSFVFQSSQPTTTAEVYKALKETEIGDKNLLVVQSGESDTRYSVNTSEQTVETVKQVVIDTLGDRLLDYSLEIGEIRPFSEGDLSGSEVDITFNGGDDYAESDGVSHDSLLDTVRMQIAESGLADVLPTATNDFYRAGSAARYKEWTIRLNGADPEVGRTLADRLKTHVESMPMFPLASKIGGRVSTELQVQALYAIGMSCIGIIGYIWLRFQQISFGLAAVAALVHDVLVTVGIIALSAYVVNGMPPLASLLQIDSFQISLDIVAALLTIIGYSVNDTIIVFDRIREVRGKSPDITVETINRSVNQTLSRTILTSFTLFLVVAILYAIGGDGIHDFAFALVVGVFVGTYSSVYIAAPVLYWLSGTSTKAAT